MRWPPPCFQVYASDELGDEAFKLASLAERGLLFSMLAYAWQNETAPLDKGRLAQLLGLNPPDVERHYGDLIACRFRADPDDPTRIFAPDLERQKQEMSDRRRKLAASGSKGGKTTQAAIRKAKREAAHPPSEPSSLAKASEMRRGEEKRSFQDEAVSAVPDPDWVRAFDGEPINGRAG